MALVNTTLSSAVGVDDRSIVVASATSVEAGRLILVDSEVMQVTKGYVTASTTVPVLRGQNGTETATHASGAGVTHGDADDFGAVGTSTVVNYPAAGRARSFASYVAAGAIALPDPGTDAVAVILGGDALAMTLAEPSLAHNGSELIIVGAGEAAHTVTITDGIGGAGSGYTVSTFAAGAQVAIRFIAINGDWCAPGAPAYGGTATDLLATLS